MRPRVARMRSRAAIWSSGGRMKTGVLLQKAQHLSLAALHHTDKLIIFGAACLPALHHIIPRTGTFLEQPALCPGIEVSRERAINHIFLLRPVSLGRHLHPNSIAYR